MGASQNKLGQCGWWVTSATLEVVSVVRELNQERDTGHVKVDDSLRNIAEGELNAFWTI